MSAFTTHPRTWCPRCEKRMRVRKTSDVCRDCERALLEQAEKDAENRSWRGFTDEERALYG